MIKITNLLPRRFAGTNKAKVSIYSKSAKHRAEYRQRLKTKKYRKKIKFVWMDAVEDAIKFAKERRLVGERIVRVKKTRWTIYCKKIEF